MMNLLRFNLWYLRFLLTFFHIIIEPSLSQKLCTPHESTNLIQIKNSFLVDKSVSVSPSSHAKFEYWNPKTNCCQWDGVTCDAETGYVVSLDLSSSWISGLIKPDSALLSLNHLQKLNLADNNFNNSQIPSGIGQLLNLTHLNLSNSRFSGEIPIREMSRLVNLVSLDLSSYSSSTSSNDHQPNLPLELPKPGLKKLFQNLTELRELNLDYVHISFPISHDTFGNLSSLVSLRLQSCELYGIVPSSLFALPHLRFLDLSQNHLTGRLDDFQFKSSSSLEMISLSNNVLHGEIPESISSLTNLSRLDLASNKLTGNVQLSFFSSLQKLVDLQLSHNSLTVLHQGNSNFISPKFRKLGLSSCNISEFPEFLRNQEAIEELSLSNNGIHGMIPKWLWSNWKDTLVVLDISQNAVTGFEDSSSVIPLNKAKQLDFHSNMFQGPVPMPASEAFFFSVSDNNLNGKIPSLICNINSLMFLDLSNNSLTGSISKCLVNISDSLAVLNLGMNNFIGEIPDSFVKGSSLRTLDLRENRLQGKVPRSLVNCTKLEVLNLGNNHLEDVFPFWLETLTELQVLVIKSNKFHGLIENPKTNFTFSKLRIICMSNNSFTGNLPSGYFQHFEAMILVDDRKRELEYMGGKYYQDSVTVINKGIEMVLVKILTTFKAADFSHNNFQGQIPDSVGDLRSIHVLNFSDNSLTGPIPSSFRNLQVLESLDLSCNYLTGEIPQELTDLTFLEVLDLSQNNLTGRIPRGNQFETFQNSSYIGNPGLCGFPLSQTCGDHMARPPPLVSKEDNESVSSIVGFARDAVLLGYVVGLIVGIVFGTAFLWNKDRWFEKALNNIGWQGQRKKKCLTQREPNLKRPYVWGNAAISSSGPYVWGNATTSWSKRRQVNMVKVEMESKAQMKQ